MSPVRARKPSYHHGDLRRALLDATLALASERGAAGVTLREAARVAGVSQTAPYRHFADKDAMLAAASEEGFHRLRRGVEEALTAADRRDAKARLVAAAVAYVRFALANPAHFRLMYGHGSPPKSATAGLQSAARNVYQLVGRAVEASVGKPAREGAVKEAYFRIWALAHGIAVLALEKQILFDVGKDALLRAAHAAIERQL